MQFTPLISLLGEDNFIPVASPWLISPTARQPADGVFSWPRFRMIQAWQVRAGIPDCGKHKGAARSRRRCPAVKGQPYKGTILSTAQLPQSSLCWIIIITESRWLWKTVRGRPREKGDRWVWKSRPVHAAAQEEREETPRRKIRLY